MTAEVNGGDRTAAEGAGGVSQRRLTTAATIHRSDMRPTRAQTKKGHQGETEHEYRR